MITGRNVFFDADGETSEDDYDTTHPTEIFGEGAILWIPDWKAIPPELKLSWGLTDEQCKKIIAIAKRIEPKVILV